MDKTCSNCLYDKVCPHLHYDDALKCGGYADKTRFVEIPCDVGDTVYCLIDENNELNSDSEHFCMCKVEKFSIENCSERNMLVLHLDFKDTDINPRTECVYAKECINKTVFITQSAISKAISERNAK